MGEKTFAPLRCRGENDLEGCKSFAPVEARTLVLACVCGYSLQVPSRLSFVTWYPRDTRSIEMAEIDGTTYKQLQDVCPCRAVMHRAPNGKTNLPDVACHDLDQRVQVSRREVHLVGR